jgi:hypothetical protein
MDESEREDRMDEGVEEALRWIDSGGMVGFVDTSFCLSALECVCYLYQKNSMSIILVGFKFQVF